MKPKKVLVVEDSLLLHKMYDLLLMSYRGGGAEVLHAYNGLEALAQLNNHPDVDLILLDINMPVMSGLEFLERCRRERIFQEIPVIIISTEGQESDTIRGLETGARAYLVKPFTEKGLCTIIDRITPSPAPVGGARVD